MPAIAESRPATGASACAPLLLCMLPLVIPSANTASGSPRGTPPAGSWLLMCAMSSSWPLGPTAGGGEVLSAVVPGSGAGPADAAADEAGASGADLVLAGLGSTLWKAASTWRLDMREKKPVTKFRVPDMRGKSQ